MGKIVFHQFKFSNLLKWIKSSRSDRTVNIFIDEFNGALIDKDEVKDIKEELTSFSKSHVVIAAQSMEHELLHVKYESKFQYELLASETSFELYELDYSLRCSVEITNFVNHSMDVLSGDSVLCSVQTHILEDRNGEPVDEEFGMQFCEHPIDGAAKRKYTFNKAKDIGHRVSCQKVQLYTPSEASCYQVNLILHHVLSGMKEKVVVCTFNSDIYNNVYKMLEHAELQWTTNITEFIERKSEFKLLLTDYASVRGFEFQNFIFMFDLSQKYLNYRLIEIFTRATTNLYLIVNLVDNEQPKLVECWKTLECVEWRELSFNENKDRFVLKSSNEQEISLEHSMSANIDYSNEFIVNYYPWYEMTYSNKSYADDYDKRKLLWIFIIKNDDIKLLNELVKIHSVNGQRYDIQPNGNLLHVAAEYNAVESCKYLLEKYHKSHIDVNDVIDISPDDMNVSNCSHCKQLVDMKDKKEEYTPFHYAALQDDDTIVNILVDNGADVNITDKSGKTPLHYAVKNNNETMVNILIDHGADVNITDKFRETPLHYAVGNNNGTIVNILFNHSADVNIRSQWDKTPLHFAVDRNYETIVNIFLHHGADVNIADELGKTPLHYAVENNNETIVNNLLDHDADVNIIDIFGKTPLHYAVGKNNETIVKFLLDRGADVKMKYSS